MSNIHRSNSTLTLNTPDQKISLQAFFISLEHFTSFLEIDYLGSLLNFWNFKNIHLSLHIAAYLSDQTEDSKLSIQFDSAVGCQLICSSKENNYNSLYSILPSSNPYIPSEKPCDYILLHFTYQELLLSYPDNYIIHLENIQNSLYIIQKTINELSKKVEKEQTDILFKIEAINKVTEQNASISQDLIDKKNAILGLNAQFESLEKEETQIGINLRCIICENNLKNIVFLPCGHLILCEDCLVQNLKIEPNVNMEKKRKSVYCQTCKVKVSESRRVSFN